MIFSFNNKQLPYWIERFFLLLFSVLIVSFIVHHLLIIKPYDTFNIGEWLINYQGGFVRRGLLGEILWQIYQLHPFNVKWGIVFIELFAFILFLLLIYKIFLKYRWSFLPILFPIGIIFSSLSSYRRDFLMLLLIYITFDSFFRATKSKKNYFLGVVIGLICLVLITHEPMFFILVPFLSVVFWQNTTGSLANKLLRTIIIFLPAIVVMALVCKMKGDATTARAIWDSWDSLFRTYPEASYPKISIAVEFLSRESKDVILMHLNSNFKYLSHPSLSVFLSNNLALLASFIGFFLLVTCIPCVDHSNRKLINNPMQNSLAHLYIFQTIMMLPMFTILSCDYGRTIPYVTITTFFAYHLLEKHQLKFSFPCWRLSYSNNPNNHSLLYPRINHPILYFIILVFTPLTAVGSPSWNDTICGVGIRLVNSIFASLL